MHMAHRHDIAEILVSSTFPHDSLLSYSLTALHGAPPQPGSCRISVGTASLMGFLSWLTTFRQSACSANTKSGEWHAENRASMTEPSLTLC